MKLEAYSIDRYILSNQRPVPCDDVGIWTCWMQSTQRVVQQTELEVAGLAIYVSTTFLGMDVNFDPETPALFETMVLGGLYDRELYRYRSWSEAKQGHEAVVLRCKGTNDLMSAASLITSRQLAIASLRRAAKSSVRSIIEQRFGIIGE